MLTWPTRPLLRFWRFLSALQKGGLPSARLGEFLSWSRLLSWDHRKHSFSSLHTHGCKNCANVAPDVFNIEEDSGRARAHNQCGNPDLVQQAIDSCLVDCIHWTFATQLSLLEDEMRRVERVNWATSTNRPS